MKMIQVPGVAISPSGFVQIEIQSKRQPDQTQRFQCSAYSDIVDYVRHSYKVDRKIAKIVKVADKHVEMVSGKEHYTIVFE